MRSRDYTTLTALCAARQFLHDYAQVLPAVIASDLPRHLDATISALRTHSMEQVLHGMRRRGDITTLDMLRTALIRDHLRPIVRIARVDLPHTPEFKVLRMPAGRNTIDQLVDAALAMAATAERFTDTFVSAGMPPTFVDALNNAIQAIVAARYEATLARGRRHGAARGVDTAVIQGHHTLQALDSLIATTLHDDPALLAGWRAVTARPRLGRPRKPRTRRKATSTS